MDIHRSTSQWKCPLANLTSIMPRYIGLRNSSRSLRRVGKQLNQVCFRLQLKQSFSRADPPTDGRKPHLRGKGELPQGHGYNLVVQLKQSADAKPQNFRIRFDQKTCNKCIRPEYACICGD